MQAASASTNGASRGTETARTTAAAKLVAAWLEGNDELSGVRTSGSTPSACSGRARSTALLERTRGEVGERRRRQGRRAKIHGRRSQSAIAAPSASQTSPKVPAYVRPTKTGSSAPTRWPTIHRSRLLVGADQGEVTVVVTVTVTRVAGTGTTVCTRVCDGPD